MMGWASMVHRGTALLRYRLNSIVCKGTNDLAVRAEVEDLSGKAAPSPFVVEGNGIDASKN